MKKLNLTILIVVTIFLLVLDLTLRIAYPPEVRAQSSTGVTISMQVVGAVSQCTWPTGVTVTNGVAWCFINTGTPSSSGMFFSLNNSTTWSPLVPTVASPVISGTVPIVVTGSTISCPTCAVTGNVVMSFQGRNGAVTLTKSDVTSTGVVAAIPASTAPLQ